MRFPLPKINRKGFTLVEIMVVVTVISILSVIGYGSFDTAQKRTRDFQRKADFKRLQVALKLYKDEFGHYPYSVSDPNTADLPALNTSNMNSWARFNNVDGWAAIKQSLVDKKYLDVLPLDPLNNCPGWNVWDGQCGFTYDYWAAKDTSNLPSPPCPKGNGQVYILIARLEIASDPDAVKDKASGDPRRQICGGDMRDITYQGIEDGGYLVQVGY